MENPRDEISTIIKEITNMLQSNCEEHHQLLNDLRISMTEPKAVSYADIIRRKAGRDAWRITYDEKNKKLWELIQLGKKDKE
jgi:hypothetical protein